MIQIAINNQFIFIAKVFGVLSSHQKTVNSSLAQPVLYPLASSGLPFLLLKYCFNFYPAILTTYTLLVVPRIFMTAKSLIIDSLIYRISLQSCSNPETAHYACILFASSFATWIFCTRTFAATYQMIFFSAILCIIIDDTYSHWRGLTLSSIATVAIHIDSTYATLVCIPLIFWILKTRETVFPKLLCFVFGNFFTVACLSLIDCFYADPNQFQQLYKTEVHFKSLWQWACKLPEVLFNKFEAHDNNGYLMDSQATWAVLWAFVPLLFLCCWNKFFGQNSAFAEQVKSYVQMMWFLVISSFMSYFLWPGENNLLLLPVFVPLIVLSAANVHLLTSTKLCAIMWILFNVVAFLFFGMLNEGGVLPSMGYLHSVASTHNQMQQSLGNTQINILLYHTQKPPIHLINWPAGKLTTASILDINVQVINSFDFLEKHINESLQLETSILYVVTPASITCDAYHLLHDNYLTELYFDLFPHFTLIDPVWQHESGCLTDLTFSHMLQHLSLNMYRVQHLSTSLKLENLHHTIQYKSFAQ